MKTTLTYDKKKNKPVLEIEAESDADNMALELFASYDKFMVSIILNDSPEIISKGFHHEKK